MLGNSCAVQFGGNELHRLGNRDLIEDTRNVLLGTVSRKYSASSALACSGVKLERNVDHHRRRDLRRGSEGASGGAQYYG
jgi:hypothetical protein